MTSECKWKFFFEGKKLKVTFGLSSFLTSFQRCHFLWVHPSFIKNLLWFYFRFNFIIFSSLEAFFAKVALKVTYFCFVHQLKVRQTRNDFFKPRFLQKTNEQNRLYYLSTCFRSFFGRNCRHQKDISKLTDLYGELKKT